MLLWGINRLSGCRNNGDSFSIEKIVGPFGLALPYRKQKIVFGEAEAPDSDAVLAKQAPDVALGPTGVGRNGEVDRRAVQSVLDQSYGWGNRVKIAH